MTTEERDKLITDNLKLVPHIAREFTKNPDMLDELVGEGNIGLVQAGSKYQEDKDSSFPSYAGTIIRNRMKTYLLALQKNHVQFDSIVNSEGLGLSETLADPLAINAEHELLRSELIGTMHKAIDRLHPREAWIIRRYYGLDGFEPMTMVELGDYVGSSKQYIYQLIQESLEFMRNYIKKS